MSAWLIVHHCDAATVETRLQRGEHLIRERFVVGRTLRLPHPSLGWGMEECTIVGHWPASRRMPVVDATNVEGFEGCYPFGRNTIRYMECFNVNLAQGSR